MKENKKRISLKWTLFLWFIAFIGITLVILWIFQVVFLNDFYKYIKTNEIKKTSNYIFENLDSDSVEELIKDVSVKNDMCVSVYDSNNQLVYYNDAFKGCMIHRLNGNILGDIYNKTVESNNSLMLKFADNHEMEMGKMPEEVRNQEGWQVKPPNDKKIESIIYAQIKEVNGEEYFVLLNSLITPVDATVNTLRIQLMYISLILVVLSLIIAFLLSKFISKPIENINTSAKQLAKGDYLTEFSGKGYREIGELADTLNYTAGELSKVDKLKNELIANISHDLRTPLTMITGYAEAMRDLPGENTSENVQVIVDEANRLSTLVNDLLDISKIQSGVITLDIKEFSITELINGILTRYNKLIAQENYNITFEHGESTVVKGDEIKISQVMYNLINNAITYTGEDKKVVVRQIVEADKVRIEVENTGDKIPEDMLPLIWDRYYKANKEHKRAVVGTGLGLSIVKGILEAHKFSYGVSSQENKTVFWFDIMSTLN